MASGIYAFERYRLIPAKRALWRGEHPVHLPRRQFDCLVLLVENRDRAVGRDELVSVLWGDAGVSDKQVNQLIVRVRKTLGDDGVAQTMIGTVSGFGYRWVIDTRQWDDEDSAVSPVSPADQREDASVDHGAAEHAMAEMPASVPGASAASAMPAQRRSSRARQ